MEMCNKISVVAPVGEAIEKTKQLLFKPFNLEKWFVLGFCAWLATLFNSGVSFPNLNYGHHDSSGGLSNITETIRENLLVIGIVGSIIAIFILAITFVLLWLNCRGHFMFIDCLAKNKAQIAEPWKNYKQQANSLFWFRLLFGILCTFVMLAFIVPIIFLGIACSANKDAIVVLVLSIVAIVLLIIIAAIIFGIIKAVTMDFVAQVMYIHRMKTIEAWKYFWPDFKQHFWKIILYYLFKFLIGLAVGTIVLTTMFVACCCLCGIGILLFVPYIGTVILLPIHSFIRLYPLCFLRQFGDAYDVFRQ
jgi:hypothetical protein